MPPYRSATLVLFFAACSSSSAGPATQPAVTTGPITSAALPGELAEATCGPLSACCGQTGAPYDDATCRGKVADKATADIASAMKIADTSYDPSGARGCVDAVRAYYGACNVDAGARAAMVRACAATFPGVRPLGTSCDHDAECVVGDGNVVCSSSGYIQMNNYKPPTCVEASAPTQLAHAKAGDTCGTTCSAQLCESFAPASGSAAPAGGICFTADGVRCDFDAQKCVALVATGSACAGTLSCEISARCQNGPCAALAKPGEACASSADCVPGSGCGAGGKCAAAAATGASCADNQT